MFWSKQIIKTVTTILRITSSEVLLKGLSQMLKCTIVHLLLFLAASIYLFETPWVSVPLDLQPSKFLESCSLRLSSVEVIVDRFQDLLERQFHTNKSSLPGLFSHIQCGVAYRFVNIIVENHESILIKLCYLILHAWICLKKYKIASVAEKLPCQHLLIMLLNGK